MTKNFDPMNIRENGSKTDKNSAGVGKSIKLSFNNSHFYQYYYILNRQDFNKHR